MYIDIEGQADVRSPRERVGINVQPVDPVTLVKTLVEIEEAGVDHVWVAFGDPHSVSDWLIESLVVFGKEDQIQNHVLELLGTPIDTLALSLVPVSDATQERVRLARLVERL